MNSDRSLKEGSRSASNPETETQLTERVRAQAWKFASVFRIDFICSVQTHHRIEYIYGQNREDLLEIKHSRVRWCQLLFIICVLYDNEMVSSSLCTFLKKKKRKENSRELWKLRHSMAQSSYRPSFHLFMEDQNS